MVLKAHIHKVVAKINIQKRQTKKKKSGSHRLKILRANKNNKSFNDYFTCTMERFLSCEFADFNRVFFSNL